MAHLHNLTTLAREDAYPGATKKDDSKEKKAEHWMIVFILVVMRCSLFISYNFDLFWNIIMVQTWFMLPTWFYKMNQRLLNTCCYILLVITYESLC